MKQKTKKRRRNNHLGKWCVFLAVLALSIHFFQNNISAFLGLEKPAATQINTPVLPTKNVVKAPPKTEPPIVLDPAIVYNPTEWQLILVNPWNPLPADWEVNLIDIGQNQQVDIRCYEELMTMLSDCQMAGYRPLVCSAYRSQDRQNELFYNKVQRVIAEGYPEEEAIEVAATTVAYPGTSEHQLGLAVDIVDENHQLLDETQENTGVQQWLMQHSWEYGFILRYPNQKSNITGIIYEPWHYRYVGKEAARELYEQDLCLEEYLEQF